MPDLLRRVLSQLLIVFLFLVACGAPPTAAPELPTATPAPSATPTPVAALPADSGWDDRTIYRGGLIEAEQGVLDGLPGATMYRVDLVIPEDFFVLEGHEELRYTNREEVPLDEVYFRLFVNTSGGKATVSRAEVNGELVEGELAFESSAYRLPLPVPLEPGDQVVIDLDFQIEVPREMGGNYGLFGYFNDILVLDEFYPAVPVYDDEGWNVEVPPAAGDLTYYDASFYLVEVTAPASLKIVASGTQVSEEVQGDQQVVTFAAGPARDFYIAASEGFTVMSEQVGQTVINSYAFPEYQQHAELALAYAVGAMESYDARFGAYPYVEFDVVSTPMQAIGIEYPGVAGMGLHLYDPGVEISGLPSQVLLQSGVAHEVAHQWFYNVVGNDQVDEPWLDEALVQYVTGFYYLDVGGEAALEGWRESWYSRWQRVEMADIPIGLPSGEYTDASEYGSVVYGRGPLFIEALAQEMGQEAFDAFLRDYYESDKWGIGTGQGFKELAEQDCQCDLTSLFETWVNGQ
jgi:hypothetical protein